MHAKIDAVLASARTLDLSMSMQAVEREGRPTLH